MKKLLSVSVAVILLLALALVTAPASASLPSSKATAQAGELSLIETHSWDTIMTNTIKTSSQKDLFVDVSLQSSLFTDTLVKSKGGNADTSSATASIKVRVLVDGVEAAPGEVIFNARTQQLTAKFAGIIQDTNGDGYFGVDDEVTEEELQLVLDTTSANSFNFMINDLSSGVHTIEVQAEIYTGGSAQAGSYEAKALIGKGSMTVEEVRLIQGEDTEI